MTSILPKYETQKLSEKEEIIHFKLRCNCNKYLDSIEAFLEVQNVCLI